MRNIITIAVAVLIMAAAVPMRAQEWTKVNDTTYVRRFEQSTGTLTEYANPVDMTALTAKLNNDMRSASICRGAAVGFGFAAAGAALLSATKSGGQNKALNAMSVVFGLACLGLEIGSIDIMSQKRVYIAPDGVVIRLNRTEQPKFDNKKARKRE
jgi:hypothetical protein